MKSKGWLSIEQNMIKYGEIEPLHKQTVTDAFLASTHMQDFLLDKYIKLFLEIPVFGKYIGILTIPVLG